MTAWFALAPVWLQVVLRSVGAGVLAAAAAGLAVVAVVDGPELPAAVFVAVLAVLVTAASVPRYRRRVPRLRATVAPLADDRTAARAAVAAARRGPAPHDPAVRGAALARATELLAQAGGQRRTSRLRRAAPWLVAGALVVLGRGSPWAVLLAALLLAVWLTSAWSRRRWERRVAVLEPSPGAAPAHRVPNP